MIRKTLLISGAVALAMASAAEAKDRRGAVLPPPDVALSPIPMKVAELPPTGAPALVQVRAAEAAIASLNPTLRAVITSNPSAQSDAIGLDAERKASKIQGPLYGVPILLKDNIEAAGSMATTAGSLALKDNVTNRDAPLVKRLRDAGMVILGKANLSEWANIRSPKSISGWSAIGGTVRNPYVLDRSACGSSSGSGAAVAAGLAPLAIGTETDGSITCPAAINGLVGLKPTVGLVSRTHIVPISHSQDTAGPMTTTVEDAAKVLTIIAGSDAADAATKDADIHKTDYAAGLSKDALKGVKLAVARFYTGYSPKTDAVFEQALKELQAQGAILVDVKDFDEGPIGKAEGVVLYTELKADMAAYLGSTDPKKVKSRTLADLIAFNKQTPKEFEWFGQESFEKAEKTKGLTDPDYLKALADSKRMAGPEGIDKILKDTGAVAIVAPTTGPAWTIDPLNGDNYGGSSTTLPAVAGYPHLTVPMGDVTGLPVGLSFIGPAWSEKLLLNLGYAYEQATHHRKPPTFRATVAP